MEGIAAKKVELAELFYDLVFVYAISCSTALIHHLHDGALDPMALLSFLVVFVVLGVRAAFMFTVAFLYAGIGLFLAGVFLATRYNRPGRRLAARDLWVNVAVFAAGLVACLLLADQQVAVNCISSLMLVVQAAYMLYLLKRKSSE